METSSRSTKLVTTLVALSLVLTSFATPVTAVSVAEEEVPDAGEVDTKLSATVRLTDLYQDPDLESWTLMGTTELTDVTWTVWFYDQGGNQVRQESHDGPTLEQSGVDLDAGVSEVAVRVTGTVPPVTDYQYDPPQSFPAMSLSVTRPGGTSTTIGTWEVHHFTAESDAAATAIDEAAAAIEAARASGANPAEAETSLEFAIDAYEGENFALATTLAEEAESQAVVAQQAAEARRLLLFAGGVVVAFAVLGALVLWYRRRRQPYDRLG